MHLHLTERNLNPKAACLKRREEEKTEELPGRALSADEMAQQAALAGKVGQFASLLYQGSLLPPNIPTRSCFQAGRTIPPPPLQVNS